MNLNCVSESRSTPMSQDPLHFLVFPFLPFEEIKTQRTLKIINSSRTHYIFFSIYLSPNGNIHLLLANGDDLNSHKISIIFKTSSA